VLADQQEGEGQRGERDSGRGKQHQDRAAVAAAPPFERREQCESDRGCAREVEDEQRPDGRDLRVELRELLQMDGAGRQQRERAEQARREQEPAVGAVRSRWALASGDGVKELRVR
jgi:hypothetical protein